MREGDKEGARKQSPFYYPPSHLIPSEYPPVASNANNVVASEVQCQPRGVGQVLEVTQTSVVDIYQPTLCWNK